MNSTLKFGIIVLCLILIGHGVVSCMNSVSPHDPRIRGGDMKQIEAPADAKQVQTVTLERPIGLWGTKFVAVLQVEAENVTLTKGYVSGSTGATFSMVDQTLGFGVSSPEFWLERQPAGQSQSDRQVFSVFVNFKRTVLLIFGEQVTSRVGDLVVMKQVQVVRPASGASSPPVPSASAPR